MKTLPHQRTAGLRATAVPAWLRLARVYHQLDRASAEHLRAYGLSVAQFDVLAQVGAHEGLTQQELADALLVTKGNVCQLVERMEQAGLVARQQEGRCKRLYLTERGRALWEQAVPAQERLIAERFAALDGAEQRSLHALLRQLDRALGR